MNFRKNGDKYLITIEVIALIVVLIFGAVHFVIPDRSRKDNTIYTGSEINTDSEQSTDTAVPDDNGDDVVAAAFTPSDSVKAKLESMTTEEKVAQMFITRPEEITGVAQFTQAGKKTKEALTTYPLGGFVFRQENFFGEAAVSQMMSNLQSYAQERNGVNMFLAIDEEGGDKSPLANGNAYTVEPLPSEMGGADAAGSSASKIASYMTTNGLNMNMSPTADIAYGDNADYDKYTFGSDSTTVADSVAAQISSYNGDGIFSVAGCFPGKGKAVADATTGMLWMTDTLADLETSDFVPYKRAIDSGVSAIMMGNVLCQSVTGEETTPCSLSSNAVNYVRSTMGFSGILITDDLSDTSLNSVYTQDEAVVAAVKAGMSMIYVSTGFEGSYNAVVEAANNGEISEEQLDDAVGRILTAKGI